MSAHRTQSAMHAGEHAPRPLVCLDGAERGPVQADVMKQAFREHADLTTHVAAARVLTSPRCRRATSSRRRRATSNASCIATWASLWRPSSSSLLRGAGRDCRVQRRFVIDDHVLTWQRQLDSNVEGPAASSMPVRYFQQYSAPDDSGIERFEPRRSRTDLFLEGWGDAHVAKTDLNRSCRHGRSPPAMRFSRFRPSRPSSSRGRTAR